MALGGTNRVNMTAAEVLDVAIGLKSKKIVLAHNHPSGDVEPSENDILTTNMLYHVCVPFGIEILDHIIIGLNEYSSLEEREIMDFIRNDETFKGYMEGQDEGLEEGEKIGIKKVARSMLEKNYTLEQIIDITGFSEKEINKLK